MRKIPTVSICVPTYGQPDRAYKALNSVFQQDFDDYEVIVTDDTPDNSVYNSINSFLEDKRFKYFKNEPALGSPGNWNRAISLASGEYIKILHHDDWLLTNESLRAFVKLLDENPQADFAFCASQNCDGKGRPKYVTRALPWQLKKLEKDSTFLARGNFVGAPSATIYRNVEKMEFDEKLKWLVDIEFYMRLLFRNKNFVFSNQPLIGITVGTPDQVTAISYQDKHVEIFEAVYVLGKITKIRGLSKTIYYNVWRLFLEFKIESEDCLIECGISKSDFTQAIMDILFYQKIYRAVVRAISLLKMVLSPFVWTRVILKAVAFRSSKLKNGI